MSGSVSSTETSVPPSSRRDRGYTLVEIVISIALMGTIVMSIMGGMWAVVRVARQNDDRAKVQAVLGSAADRIGNYQYVPCPEDANSYQVIGEAAAAAVGWEASTVQIVDYQFWDPDTGSWAETNSIQGTECNQSVGLTTSKTLQKLTVEVTSPAGSYSTSLDVVKSDIRPKEVKDASAP